jgi:hypothetical protein
MTSGSADRPALRRYWWVLPAGGLLTALLIAFEFTPRDGFSPGFFAVPLDDAWVHFMYAHNALRSGLLHYNPGQPAAGTSSLLWVLLLALPLRLGLYPTVVAKVLGILSQAALAGAMYATLARLTNRWLAALGACLICADPMLMFASLSGMETTLYSCLAFGAAAALLLDRLALAGGLAAATAIVRPDGALLPLLLLAGGLLHGVFASRRLPQLRAQFTRHLLWLAAPTVVAGLFWAWLNWRATGRLLPASFYVRAGGMALFTEMPAWRPILSDFGQAGSFIGHPWQWMLYALGLLWIAWRRDARYLAVVLFPWLLAFLLGGDKLQIIGGTFLGHRYIAPGLPFFLFVQLLGGAFIADLLREKRVLHRSYRHRHLPVLVALLTVVLLVGDPRVIYRRLVDHRAEYVQACAEIEAMHGRIGRWLKAHTPATAIVGLYDAGAIAYVSERRAVDILGLNTPHVAPLSPQVVADLDYLVTFPALSRGVETPYADREVFRVDLGQTRVIAAPTMVVYRIQGPPDPSLPAHP